MVIPDERTEQLAPPVAHDTSTRAAVWVLAGVEAVAAALWLVQSRSRWFFGDEWEFLVDRSLSLRDLFDDHNGHWSTLPVLLYRSLWAVAGLHSYVPYVVFTIAAHLAAAALLFVVMRRAGVHPWIATSGASLYALFGAGYQDVMWAFQIGYSGALALGLASLLLADHEGPVDRRDGIALAAGLGSLLCSGVGVAMVVAVVLAVLLRRGVRVALLYGGVLGGVYALWWITLGRDGTEGPGYVDATAGEVIRFVGTGTQAVFGNLGQVPGTGLVLGVLFVGGLAALAIRGGRATLHRVALPVALAVGGLLFLVGSGLSRAGLLGPEFARASRYQHIVAALVLPALAVALDALARNRRALVAGACALLVLGVPGNVAAIGDGANDRAAEQDVFRHLLLAIPRTSVAADVPPSVRPFSAGLYERRITAGWLRDAAADGHLPGPGRVTRADRRAIRASLAFVQSRIATVPTRCPVLTAPEHRRLAPGDTVEFRSGRLVVATAVPPATAGDPLVGRAVFDAADGRRITAVLGPVDVVLSAKNAFLSPVRLCEGS